MRSNKKSPLKSDKTQTIRTQKRGVVGYSRKTALLEEAITQMNAGKYGRSSAALKELLALDPVNMEARRLFATLHLRLGSLIPAKQAFDSLITEAFQRQDYWLAESLLREYLAAGPRCVPFLEQLGSIYQEKGDTLEAVTEYGKAIDILVEDPDPENPLHAAQLYAKIRELAPASPVAFRVASFFDPETGELLVRKAGSDEATAPAPAPEVHSDGQSKPGHPESGSGAMPWDVQDPPEVVELSSEPAQSSEPVSAITESVNTDALAHEGQRHDQGAASPEVSAVDQAEHDLSNIQVEVTEKAPAVETPVRQLEPDPVASVADSSAHPELEQSSASASPEIPSADADAASPQTATIDNVRAEAALSPPDESPASQALPSGTSEPWKQAGFSWESVFNSAWKFTDLPPVKEAPPEPAPTHLEEAAVEVQAISPSQGQELANPCIEIPERDAQSSSGADVASGSAVAPMPWDQVQEATISIPPAEAEPLIAEGSVAARLEEAPVEAAAGPVTQDQGDDNLSIEIPERDAQSSSGADVASGSVVAPMPWDQVQEATISIPPAEAEPLIAEGSVAARLEEAPVEAAAGPVAQDQGEASPSLEIAESETPSPSQVEVASGSSPAPMSGDQVQEATISLLPVHADSSTVENRESVVEQSPVQAESSRTTTDDEPRSQSPSLPSPLIAEPESFSLVQDSETPHSLEQTHAGDETGEASAPVGGTDQSAEPEPPFRLASLSAIKETPAPLEPTVELGSPVQADEPVAETPAIQEEASPEYASLSLNRAETPATAISESAIQKPEAEPSPSRSQPVEEIAAARSEEVQPSRPIPEEQTVVEPVPESHEVSSVSRKTPTSVLREDQSAEASPAEPRSSVQDTAPPQEEEWVRRSASIRFVQPQPAAPVTPAPQPISDTQEVSRPLSVAAAAVDVLFESAQNPKTTETRERAVESKPPRTTSSLLSRIGNAVTNFVSSCFSTTRAIVATLIGLVVLSGLFVALGIGAIALTWVIMEEPPAPAFQSFTTIPQRTVSDSKKNGYTILMGLEASAGSDLRQADSHEKPEARDGRTALTCFGSPGSETGDRSNASASVMRGWVRKADPVGQFRANQETIKGWGSRNQIALERYGQWQKLPFEDWGYGQPGSPPCAAMAFAHQLYVADGFVQGTDIGVDRLEADMEAWRAVLGQARTLPVKMLALQAINDDIAVASGMLARSDFDGKHLGRITKFLRPMDQGELSMRWPMQSELVSAAKTYEGQLKAVRAEDQSIYTTVASVLPLPKQRRLNDYAEYYEASYKAAGEKQYGSLPKWKDYVRFPAAGVTDYLTNPIENVIGLEPLPAWDLYNGLTVDTDAHLRLASLQAWLRRGSSESDLLTRIAKAGQGLYDPYTGLPMLVNMKKGVLYSVGHDGKDQDADPQVDVVVDIPLAQTSAAPAKPSATSSKSR